MTAQSSSWATDLKGGSIHLPLTPHISLFCHSFFWSFFVYLFSFFQFTVGCNQDKLMKDVIDLDNEYMDAFYVCLNKIIPGVDNWRQLATAFGIPCDIYKDFDPKEPTSPTKQLFEWLFADRTELTLDQLCSALKCIKRNDLVGDVRKCFEQC